MSVTPIQGIKSIQRGVTSTGILNSATVAVTISAVKPEKTILTLLGFNATGADHTETLPAAAHPMLELENSTTLRIKRNASIFNGGSDMGIGEIMVSWQIVEYQN